MEFSKEEKYLRETDQKLKKIIDLNGHIVFKPEKQNQFNSLVSIVVSQFISTKASISIFNEIKKHFDTDFLDEIHFENYTISEIKNLGLSRNKAKTIKYLSNYFMSEDFQELTRLNQKTLHETLNSIFGIGPWSVSMFEIFCLGKLDIFTSRDAGLRHAMNKSGMVKADSKWIKYEKYAKKWSPYKSIASIHLWRTVD